MGSYTITTTDSEDTALAWAAQNSTASMNPPPEVPPDAATYLDETVHAMLFEWERQYAIATTPAPVNDVAAAYVKGTPEQQQQVLDILGVPPGEPGTAPMTRLV